MAETCPRCERPIATESPRGLCPVCCLLDLGFGHENTSVQEEVPGIELGPVLGKGTFGRVHEGIELHAGYRQVAVKILRGEAQGTVQRARFLEEIQVLALLNHPHIATILGSGRTSTGSPFYVMELIEGDTLDTWSRQKSLAEKLRVLRQTASAVAHAHQKGIAHRDLKPTNILVTTESDKAKVIDFGIARAFEGPASWARNQTTGGQRMGSPHYMSPEQLAGDPNIDLRTDIWSLGLLLYELALGEPLLDKVLDTKTSWEKNGELLRDFPFPELADRELDWIARKACALDPRDRYPTGQALLEDLEAKEKGAAVSVGLSYTGYRVKKSLARNRLGYSLAGAALLLIITLGIAGWLLSAQERASKKEISRKHKQALAAEELARRTASDNALLAGTRAIDSQTFSQARESIRQALDIWPGNSAATFASNYLNATLPEATLEKKFTLPHLFERVATNEQGDFLLKTPEGKVFRYEPGNGPSTTRVPFPEKQSTTWQDRERSLKISLSSRGILSFQDLETGSTVMSPLVFGSGSEQAAYSNRSGHILVTNGTGQLSLWSLEKLRQGFQKSQLKRPALWLGFERSNNQIWMVDNDANLFHWLEKKAPRKAFRFADPDTSYFNAWDNGESHSRGLPGGWSGVKNLLQRTSWAVTTETVIERSINARDSDVLVSSRSDHSIWVQQPGQFYEQVEGITEPISAFALNSSGTTAVHISDQNQARIINVNDLTLGARWTLSKPASDASILDTNQLVVAHSDGSITIWSLDGEPAPLLSFQAGQKSEKRPHVRSIPGKAELLYAVDGDVALRRFSALTGELVGSPLRHQKGVHWLCFSIDPDILFTIDQSRTGPGTLRVWSLRLAREIVPGIDHPDQILWATLLGQSNRIATSCSDGSVRRWILTETYSSGKKENF